MIASLNSGSPVPQVASAPFVPMTEAGTAADAQSQFALLLDAFASLDSGPTTVLEASESGNPAQPAAMWMAMPSLETKAKTSTVGPNAPGEDEPDEAPEVSVENGSASPSGTAAILLPAPPEATPNTAGSDSLLPEAAHEGEPESEGARVTIKNPGQIRLEPAPAAHETEPPESAILRTKSSAASGSTLREPSGASQQITRENPPIEAFAVELVTITPNEAPGAESTRPRRASRAGAEAQATTESGSTPANTSGSAEAARETPLPPTAGRRSDGQGPAERDNHHRDSASHAERELRLAPEQRAAGQSIERHVYASAPERPANETAVGLPRPATHESENMPARPAAESVRQIEALRFGGVNLGRSGPVHDVEIRIPLADTPVDLKLTSRAGAVDVSVRVADPQLAQDLRAHLPRLLEALESRGYESSSAERKSETADPQLAQPTRSAYNVESEQHQNRRRDQQPPRSKPGTKSQSADEAEEFRLEPEIRIFS